MISKVFKSIVSVCLAAAVLALPGVSSASAAPGSALSTGDALIKNKEEVIYATLGSDGSTESIYAVNHFVVTRAGQVTDYGDYASTENLTSTGPLTQNGDSVSFHADEGNFYYQGTMDAADLPWRFDISYSLDGVKIAPQDLAGKSGKLEIHMVTDQNEKIDPVFYQNYMLQISMTLDTDKCSDIEAPGATVASAGKNAVITYVLMPGKGGDISLSSSVHDFAMAGIQISAMPLSLGIKLPDTGDMMDKMTTLSDAVSSLNNGVKKLNNGVAQMSNGTVDLVNGSAGFQNGLSQLSGNSDQLTQASAQIDSALAQIVYSLNNPSGGMDLSAFAQLPDGLDQLSQGLNSISGGLAQLKGGFTDAENALNSAVADIPNIPQSDIESLSAAIAGLDESQRSTYDRLLAAYTAAQTVKGTYLGPHGNDGVKAAFDSVRTSLGSIPGSIDTISQTLSGMSAGIRNALSGSNFADQMQQLKDGLTALSSNYGQFHSGLMDYTNGVKALSSNYGKLHAGLVSFSDGIVDLHKGTKDLYAGTSEMNEKMADLPETMQTEINNLMKDYDKSDFKPVSFISAKNTNVSLVQFVFKTSGIELKQETTAVEPAPVKMTIWDRFLALFSPKQ